MSEEQTFSLPVPAVATAEPTKPAAPDTWVGTKPPVECYKSTSICGYGRCKAEGRCLQAPRVLRKAKEG